MIDQDVLKAAVDGYNEQLRILTEKRDALTVMLNGSGTAKPKSKRAKRVFSAQTRARMQAAQKARWAKIRRAKRLAAKGK